jgi:hypothetical protein
MAAGGGMTFVRAHLSVHAKLAAAGSTENLTLAAKWSGAARNFGTVVAFVLPVMVYQQYGWSALLAFAMVVMLMYIIVASVQHAYCDGGLEVVRELSAGLVEEAAPVGSAAVPWIDWVMAAAFCVTELQMNVQAAAVPTILMRQFEVPTSVCGPIQAVGQLVAMGFLVILSKGYAGILQKRPLNLILSFFGTFVGMSLLCWSTLLRHTEAAQAIFVLSLYFFYIFAYTAQVTMLECLTGVLDMQNAIVVIGVSEMIGCACSLVGGYLGPVLLEVSPAAPFVLQLVIALTTTLLVAFSLGHRAMSQMVVVCETKEQYLATLVSVEDESPSIRKSLQGLNHMRKRPESYIGVEQLLRKQSHNSFFPSSDESFVSDTVGPEALKESLLQQPSPLRAGMARQSSKGASCSLTIPKSNSGQITCGHWDCADVEDVRSREVPIPDLVTSTFEGRQLKKTMACFDRAYIDIDTEDYVVDRSLVQQLVMNQVACEGQSA